MPSAVLPVFSVWSPSPMTSSCSSDLAAAGVAGFQVRDKAPRRASLLAFDPTRAVAAVRPTGATVIVNDRSTSRWPPALTVCTWAASDLPVAVARRLAPDLLIGATCRDAAAVATSRRGRRRPMRASGRSSRPSVKAGPARRPLGPSSIGPVAACPAADRHRRHRRRSRPGRAGMRAPMASPSSARSGDIQIRWQPRRSSSTAVALMRVHVLGAGIVGLACAGGARLARPRGRPSCDPAARARGVPRGRRHALPRRARPGTARTPSYDPRCRLRAVVACRTPHAWLVPLARHRHPPGRRSTPATARWSSARLRCSAATASTSRLLGAPQARALEPALGPRLLGPPCSRRPRPSIRAPSLRLCWLVSDPALSQRAPSALPDVTVIATGARLPAPFTHLVRGVRGEILRAPWRRSARHGGARAGCAASRSTSCRGPAARSSSARPWRSTTGHRS